MQKHSISDTKAAEMVAVQINHHGFSYSKKSVKNARDFVSEKIDDLYARLVGD